MEALAKDVLNELDDLYGPDSPHPKAYHNRSHTESVCLAAQWIGVEAKKAGKITDDDLIRIQIAGLFHDHTQGSREPGVNEAESAKVARRAMATKGVFEDEDMDEVEGMIKSTVVKSDGHRILQSASADNLLEQIVCDADLAILGSPFDHFWPKALGLLRERLGKKLNEELTEEEIEAFAQDEIKFLQNHQFYTSFAAKLYPHTEQNIRLLQEGRYKGYKVPGPMD